MEAALDALSHRALTRHEVQERLDGKGYTSQESLEALRRLEEWGYLDDRRLALGYGQARVRDGWARARLRLALSRRGVDRAVIDEVLNEVYAEGLELEQCIELVRKLWEQEEKKAERRRHPSQAHFGAGLAAASPRQKIGAKLMQRGYPMDIVVKALDNFYKPN
ncbi:regulatory protein RecX [Peptococcaceae bacterium CEB3]|nr:regulatory protein RecX [Peptococcaceae bacterium CEB3]